MPLRLPRRKLLKAAIAAGLVSALGAAAAVVRSTGYRASPGKSLSAAHWEVVAHLARRVCAADRADAPSPDDVGVVAFVDGYAAKMAPRLRRDLFRFFTFVEQLAPVPLGMTARFTRLSPADQDAVLASLEKNDHDLLRGGFESVKALLFMGYYKDPRTWSIVGYDGPLLGRTP